VWRDFDPAGVVGERAAVLSADRGSAAVIEVRHLRYFVVVAEELHFGRAAERLHMSQSPLSHQIRQLEREIGVELVNRAHHVVGLTDAGQVFLRAAKVLLDDLDRAVYLSKRASRGEVGTLCVGYVSEVTADLLPLSLKAFKDGFPDIEIDLRAGTTGALLDALRRRQVDVAFVRSPGIVDDLDYEQLIEEALFVALPSGHEHLASNRVRPLADLASEAFVMPTYEAAQGLRKDIDAACAQAGLAPTVSREISPLTSVLLLVAAGAGVAFMPASVAHSYPVPGVDYAQLSGPPVTTAGMAWRRNESSQLIGNFLEVTRRVAADQDHQPDVWPERHVEQSTEEL
jgi:DNA-binding transcriptional LysR family regulator